MSTRCIIHDSAVYQATIILTGIDLAAGVPLIRS